MAIARAGQPAVSGIRLSGSGNDVAGRWPGSVFQLLREVLLVGFGYLVYSQIRGISAGRTVDAAANASRIIDIEGKLGIFRELNVQALVLPHSALIQIFNMVYFYAFFPLLVPTAAWLYLKRPANYSTLRNAFLLSGAIAALLFVLLPTAPPRLAGVGFVDTLDGGLAPSYSSIPGVNQFAAFPSMHVGWTLLTTVGLSMAFGRSSLRYAVWVLPAVMLTATVVTGNHYFIDGLAGVGVSLVGLGLARVLGNRTSHHVAVSLPSRNACTSSAEHHRKIVDSHRNRFAPGSTEKSSAA